jgi:hypothetical protein
VKWKRVPESGPLSTQIFPPIISTKRVEIVSPKPVPPYFRVVEVSACVKVTDQDRGLLARLDTLIDDLFEIGLHLLSIPLAGLATYGERYQKTRIYPR